MVIKIEIKAMLYISEAIVNLSVGIEITCMKTVDFMKYRIKQNISDANTYMAKLFLTTFFTC